MSVADDRFLIQSLYHRDSPEQVAALIERGADYKAKNHQPLRVTVEQFRPKSFLALIEHGYRPAYERGEGASDPIPADILRGAVAWLSESVEALIEVLDYPPHASVMSIAAMGGSASLMKALLDKGGDPNAVNGLPLLATAAHHNAYEVAEMLIEAGADPEACDGQALKVAEEKGYKDFAYLLTRSAHVRQLNVAQQQVAVAGGVWF